MEICLRTTLPEDGVCSTATWWVISTHTMTVEYYYSKEVVGGLGSLEDVETVLTSTVTYVDIMDHHFIIIESSRHGYIGMGVYLPLPDSPFVNDLTVMTVFRLSHVTDLDCRKGFRFYKPIFINCLPLFFFIPSSPLYLFIYQIRYPL